MREWTLTLYTESEARFAALKLVARYGWQAETTQATKSTISIWGGGGGDQPHGRRRMTKSEVGRTWKGVVGQKWCS